MYAERGFDGTTTAEIAARAGVNHRTFFRHFPDKREVLFDGETDLRDALVQAITEAPEDLSPFGVLLAAFRVGARILEENRPFSSPRLKIIAATPALRERDLSKGAMLSSAIARALRQRGIPDGLADLASKTGWVTFHHAAEVWIDDPSQSLDAYLTQAFDDLHELASNTPQAS